MVKALTTHAGDRWFESGRSHFAEKSDYFMIFEVHLQSESDCSLAGKPRNSNPAVLCIVPTRLLSSLIKHYFNYGHVVTKQGKYFRK